MSCNSYFCLLNWFNSKDHIQVDFLIGIKGIFINKRQMESGKYQTTLEALFEFDSDRNASNFSY